MDKSENRTLVVKIICLLLSFGLWLYVSNVENPLRTYELKNVPVELINEQTVTDSKLAIDNKQQFTVDLKLEGPSSDIIKVKKEDFKIVADMSSYALKTGENTIPVQVVSYPENIDIKNMGLLGIKVNLEELAQKQVPIKSKVKVTYKENIYEKDQLINPKTVTVTGGKSYIDKVSEAILTGEEKDIDADKQSDYKIKFVDSSGNEINNVSSSSDTAKLSIEVTNGKSVPIKLKTAGSVPNGFVLDGYELSQNYINILGDSQNLSKIDSIDTETVDMSSLQSDSEMEIKLNLPNGISALNGENTIKVKFKVEKEAEKTKDLTCNVQCKNLNEAFSLGTQNLTTNITLTGNQAALDNITAQNVNVVLDLSKISEEGTFELTPQATLVNGSDATISGVGSISVVIKKKG